MLSIFCNTSLLRRPLLSLHLVESLAQCCSQDRRQVFTSATSFNSGRFRKIKPVTSSFLSRSSVKQIKETSNPAFGREFLDWFFFFDVFVHFSTFHWLIFPHQSASPWCLPNIPHGQRPQKLFRSCTHAVIVVYTWGKSSYILYCLTELHCIVYVQYLRK